MPTIQGIVESANERGVRIGGTWYNMSRWPKQGSATPSDAKPGERVVLEIDGQGFIRNMSIVASEQPNNQPQNQQNNSNNQSQPSARNATPEWVRAESLRLALELYRACDGFAVEDLQTLLTTLIPVADEIHDYLTS